MRLYILIVSAISLFYTSCLELPSAIDENKPLESITICTKQSQTKDSTLLKINPNESATIYAVVKPASYKSKLKFNWYSTYSIVQDENETEGENEATLLGKEYSLEIPQGAPRFKIPDSLTVEDEEGNRIEKKFNVIVNSPPIFEKNTTPSQNSTVFANKDDAITFSWAATDSDQGDALTYTLIIDGVSYNVGELNKVQQSGFKAGTHNFQAIVQDPLNDADTLELITFTVKEPTGGNP